MAGVVRRQEDANIVADLCLYDTIITASRHARLKIAHNLQLLGQLLEVFLARVDDTYVARFFFLTFRKVKNMIRK